MSDKDIIKKLLKIASNQQKIITKLAQAAETEDQKKARWEAEKSGLKLVNMFNYGKLSSDNPYRSDPFYGGESPSGTAAPAKANPSTLAKTPVKTDAPMKQVATTSGVSQDLASLLQTGAPGLKGALAIKQNGKFLDISYNADQVRKLGLSANDVKRVLTNAVSPRFEISDVVGLTNPDSSFKPNWS